MNIIRYLVPAVFSVIMLINGALRYWGRIDRESVREVRRPIAWKI